jgi:hypothetical protein
MDLVALQKKAILIPTPGQGEQEYLATYLQEQRLFYSCCQENFNLENALMNARNFPFSTLPVINGIDEQVIQDWLVSVRQAVVSQ